MSAQPKTMQIVARYEASKESVTGICRKCKHDSVFGCLLKGRHVDAVEECFMFGKDEKKGLTK